MESFLLAHLVNVQSEADGVLALLVPCPDYGLEALEKCTALHELPIVFTQVQLDRSIGSLNGCLALVHLRYVHELLNLSLSCVIEHKVVFLGSFNLALH